MFSCEIVKVTRKAKCRGINTKCQCNGKAGIKVGEECLKISVSIISNSLTAFYCKTCMFDVLDDFRKLIHFIDTGVKV